MEASHSLTSSLFQNITAIFLYIAIAVGVFLPAIHETPGPRRQRYLPLLVIPLAVHLATRHWLPFRDTPLPEIWFFGTVTWFLHAPALLFIDEFQVTSVPRGAGRGSGWNWAAVGKLFFNYRRFPIPDGGSGSGSAKGRKSANPGERARFVGGRMLRGSLAASLWFLSAILREITLQPEAADYENPVYLHLHLDRAALIRAFAVVDWVAGCYILMTLAHTAMAVLFVAVLRWDEPEEWPPLWGDLREAYSVRRFWGKFWHPVATLTVLSYGRAFSRRVLRLRVGSGGEKMFLAFWVFAISGALHCLVSTLVADLNTVEVAGASPATGMSLGHPAPRPLVFYLANFVVGLGEFGCERGLREIRNQPNREKTGARSKGEVTASRRIVGYVWVFFVLYCLVPVAEYPYYD